MFFCKYLPKAASPPGNSGCCSTEVKILFGSSSVTCFTSELPTGSSILMSAFGSPLIFFWPGSATSNSFTVGGCSFTSLSGFTTGGGNFTWSTFGFGGSGGGGGGFCLFTGGGGWRTTGTIFTFSSFLGIKPAMILMIVGNEMAKTNAATPIISALVVLKPLFLRK